MIFTLSNVNSLIRKVEVSENCVMVIEDTKGWKFGAYCSEKLRFSDEFYGTGESFVFTFKVL